MKKKKQTIKKQKTRSTKYPYNPIYCERIIEFFSPPYYTVKDMTITKSDGSQIDKTEREALPPRFMSDFAASVGIKVGYRGILEYWREKHPEFKVAYEEAKELEIQMYRVNGAIGLYNASFSIFTLKNIAGWRDATQTELTGEVKYTQMPTVKIDGVELNLKIDD